LEEENRRLQQTLDKVLEAVKPGIREEEMQAEINALNELIKRKYFQDQTTSNICCLSGVSFSWI